MTLEIVHKPLAERIQKHAQAADAVRREAKLWSALVGKPAPDWDATDIAEDVQSLKQYRGKVILLDFWYRGCSSCIRVMPEIKRLAKHFEDEPVVVLGVNVNKRAEDAIDVIQKMQLAHPTIRGEAIALQYQVYGYPTLVIIDQHGIVRDLYMGYDGQFATSISPTVEKLLRKETRRN